jgi:sulfur carrier protein ThiS
MLTNSGPAMTIVVHLFGPQAVLAGTRELPVDVPSGITAGDLLASLAATDARLAPSLRYSRIAVNFEFVGADAVVTEHDEVALIGMLSGG